MKTIWVSTVGRITRECHSKYMDGSPHKENDPCHYETQQKEGIDVERMKRVWVCHCPSDWADKYPKIPNNRCRYVDYDEVKPVHIYEV